MPAQSTAAKSNAERLFDTMVALHKGEITPDQYRAVFGESRATRSEAEHDADKFKAMCSFNRNGG